MNNIQSPIIVACEKAGGQRKLAQILGVSPAYINQLVKGARPIPPKHCLTIDLKLGVSRRSLRPHDWWQYWPEPDSLEILRSLVRHQTD
ncbi:transcriptional regulator [Undibacterium sp. Ji22W]|uniref:transcriptional regulator n=1 Tax=Undibacterium sp. Ji22W TaxID=3413038 RepID=UPI003BF404BC